MVVGRDHPHVFEDIVKPLKSELQEQRIIQEVGIKRESKTGRGNENINANKTNDSWEWLAKVELKRETKSSPVEDKNKP